MPSPPYLLPRSDLVELPASTAEALDRLEHQFDLPTEKLKQILDQFEWEYKQGLKESPDPKTGKWMSVSPTPTPTPALGSAFFRDIAPAPAARERDR